MLHNDILNKPPITQARLITQLRSLDGLKRVSELIRRWPSHSPQHHLFEKLLEKVSVGSQEFLLETIGDALDARTPRFRGLPHGYKSQNDLEKAALESVFAQIDIEDLSINALYDSCIDISDQCAHLETMVPPIEMELHQLDGTSPNPRKVDSQAYKDLTNMLSMGSRTYRDITDHLIPDAKVKPVRRRVAEWTGGDYLKASMLGHHYISSAYRLSKAPVRGVLGATEQVAGDVVPYVAELMNVGIKDVKFDEDERIEAINGNGLQIVPFRNVIEQYEESGKAVK